jgi:hypothetical protein
MQGIERFFLVPDGERIGGSKMEMQAKQVRLFQLWETAPYTPPCKRLRVYVAVLGEIGLSLRPGFLSREGSCQ